MTHGDPRSYDGPEPAGLEIRPVTPGYEYILKRGDGTAKKGWARTRAKARRLGQEAGSS